MGNGKASCRNRLIIIGSARAIQRLTGNDDWAVKLKGRHITWLEISPKRHVCEFTSRGSPLIKLQKLSQKWSSLIFLLDYQCGRSKGLVKAWKGKMESCEIQY